jgi:MYXO-CTERM domain-containing protein
MVPSRLATVTAGVVTALAVVTVGAAPASAVSASDIQAAVSAFQSGQKVYVAPGVTDVDAGSLTSTIGSQTIYVAVFKPTDNKPASASVLAGANQQGVYLSISEDGSGGYAVSYAGHNVRQINLTSQISTESTKYHGNTQGLANALVADTSAAERQANSQTGTSVATQPASQSSGSGAAVTFLVIVLALAAVLGFFVVRRRRRKQALEAEQFAQVRGAADEDVTSLGEAVTGLNLDINTAQPEARQYYEQALGAYDHAKQALAVARRPEDLRGVSAALEEGRWALAATTASAAGRAIPERRPPCFFNPQHGPSVADVEYSPDGGAPRMVPVCGADLDRVQRGLQPDVRQLAVGGQMVPYYNAGAMYAPWAGGYYGGFGGLMPGIFGGLLLADLLTPSYGYGYGGGFGGGFGSGYDQGYEQGYDQGAGAGQGDWSGGGGGGDWGGGGGDWGGGGGDFGGGGGDFGGGGGDWSG